MAGSTFGAFGFTGAPDASSRRVRPPPSPTPLPPAPGFTAPQDLDAAARAALEALHAAAAAVGSCAGSAASLRQRLDGPAASPRDALPDAEATAAALLEHWREAGPQRADEEELSRLAAARR